MMDIGNIKPLSEEVRSRLRSGVAITSLAQCVEELVLNSCDAGATCIAVRVDAPNYKVQVIDNGSGINKDQMRIIGERYATSKCHSIADLENLRYFGFRGEALASLRDVTGVLEITSRSKCSSKTFCKLFKNGKPLEVFEAKQPRPSIGTTITVHDFFHNFPVRRKALLPSLDFERARQRLESIALLQNSISFTLRNDYSGVKVLQTHKTNSVLNTFGQIFGMGKAKSLRDASYFHNQIKIAGHIGIEGHTNKNIQFIYINGRLVLKTKLHKLVNLLLSKSLIVKSRGGVVFGTSRSKESGGDFVASPRNTDLHPMYVLDIRCPLSEYDICLEPAKTLVEFRDWESVLQCMEHLIVEFLKKENLTMKVDMPKDLIELEALLSDEECTIGATKEEDEMENSDERVRDETGDTSKYDFSVFARDSPSTDRYGGGISTLNYSNTLQSFPAKRQCHSSKTNSCEDAQKEQEHNFDPQSDMNTLESNVTDESRNMKTAELADSTIVNELQEADSIKEKSDNGKENRGAGTDTDNKTDAERVCSDEQSHVIKVTDKPPPATDNSETSALKDRAHALIRRTDTELETGGSTLPQTSSGIFGGAERKIGSSSMRLLYDKLKEARQGTTMERLGNTGHIRLKDYTSSLQQFRRNVKPSETSQLGRRSETLRGDIVKFDKPAVTSDTLHAAKLQNATELQRGTVTNEKPIVLSTSFSLGLRSKFPRAKPQPLDILTDLNDRGHKDSGKEENQHQEKEGENNGKSMTIETSHQVCGNKSDIPHQDNAHPTVSRRGQVNPSGPELISTNMPVERNIARHDQRASSGTERTEDRCVPSVPSLHSFKSTKVRKPDLSKLSQKISESRSNPQSFTVVKRSVDPSTSRLHGDGESRRKWFASSRSFVQTVGDNLHHIREEGQNTDGRVGEKCRPKADQNTMETDVVLQMANDAGSEERMPCEGENTKPKRKADGKPENCTSKKLCGTNEDRVRKWTEGKASESKPDEGSTIQHDHVEEMTENSGGEKSKEAEVSGDTGENPVETAILVPDNSENINTVLAEDKSRDYTDTHQDMSSSADGTRDDVNPDSIHGNTPLKTAEAEELQETNEKGQTGVGSSSGESETLGNNWICRFDVSLGKRLYVDLTTGETRFVPPSKTELQPNVAEVEHITGASSSICTAMNASGDNFTVHPYLSHNATPFLPKGKKERLLQSTERDSVHDSSRDAERSDISHMWEDYVEEQSDDVASKWRDQKRYQADESGQIDELFKAWQNPVFPVPETSVLDASAASQPANRNQVKIRGTVNQYKFTKDMFDTVQVLGQVDDKFVACLIDTNSESNDIADPNLIVLIDQHAAHERVRLEQLTQDAYETDENNPDADVKAQIKSSLVTPPVTISLTPPEVRLLQTFRQDISRLGVTFDVCGETDIQISSLPACLMEREANQVRRGREPVAISIIETLLKEHIDLLQQTSGASAVLPRTLTKVLYSQACHGAIKFGDPLQHHECVSLIKSLSRCCLPFQCAHGRPSLAPIIDLKVLQKQLQTKGSGKPKLWKLKQMMAEDREQDLEL